MVARASLLVVVAACSSNKPRANDDAVVTAPHHADAAPAPDAPAVPTATTGDLQIRVEWRDVPVAVRASPGRTPCKTARAPAVAPTTTWGIPDVLVVVDGATLPPRGDPGWTSITLADCTLAPRLVAASAVALESAVDRPATVTFAKRGEWPAFDKLAKPAPRTIQLPIAGHTVTLPLDDKGIYELAAGDETAWIVASPSAGVTEPNGQLLVKDLAPGKYAITAWLPPRAGAAAKSAKGTATVVAGDLADLTLVLE